MRFTFVIQSSRRINISVEIRTDFCVVEIEICRIRFSNRNKRPDIFSAKIEISVKPMSLSLDQQQKYYQQKKKGKLLTDYLNAENAGWLSMNLQCRID